MIIIPGNMIFRYVIALQIKPNQLLYQQHRYKSKINIQKPREPHYLRGLVNTFLTPYYENPIKDKTLDELCKKPANKTAKIYDPSPYDVIIAREVFEWFDNSRLIAFLHKNRITGEEQFDFQVLLKRSNMYYRTYGRKIMSIITDDPRYAPLAPLFSAQFGIVYSTETNVAALEKILRKCPQVILMAGILDGKLLHHDDFLKYGKQDITTARSGLVQTLQNAGGNNLTQQLTHHQSTLVTRLNQIGTNETAPDENEQSASV